MDLDEQLNQMIRYLKKHRPHHDDEAMKYKLNILKQVKDLNRNSKLVISLHENITNQKMQNIVLTYDE